MSEVRRGQDTVLRRPVAVKLLRGDGDPRSVARFEREARVLARLHHPNVVTVFDVGADGDDRFIVMELVDGPTLRQVLDQRGRLDPTRAATIAGGIAAALAYAHERDIVHRDVKPSNVLVGSGDRVKLADLGIAKLLSVETSTATTGVLGTAHYISPEQARGGPVDGRADLYSLDCVLFEMLAGRPPFEGDPAALMYAHVHRPAPRIRSLEPAVPERFDALVAALLEKEPLARPHDARAVRAALEEAREQSAGAPSLPAQPLGKPESTIPLAPPGKPEPTRRMPADRTAPLRRWYGAAAVALLLLLLLALLPVLTGDAERDRRAGAGPVSPTGSPATNEPSGSPAGALSPQEAARQVFDVVSEGIAAGEVRGGIVGEVQHKIDEALRELTDHHDLEKALEKVAELEDKVTEALEKGEITSRARADAINHALDDLAAALEALEAEALPTSSD